MEMTSPSSYTRSVGILGGGQLARLLAQAAIGLGLRAVVLAEAADAPAAQTGAEVVLGGLSDRPALTTFLSRVSIAVFENEFVDTCLLLDAAQGLQIRYEPSLEVLFLLQNKLRQKELLLRLGIPSASFATPPGPAEGHEPWLRSCFTRFPGGFVLKWATLGYDGKGVYLVSRSEQLEDALKFCEEAFRRGVQVFAEERIDFLRELALVVSFSTRGEFTPYPLVISEQQRGICRKVIGPATSFGATERQQEIATAAARALALGAKVHGTFAVEFFEARDGTLLVNELAPRVHNSGHYTSDACETSQFENHWRAVLGMPLGPVNAAPAFAMLNLLGPEGVSLRSHPDLLPEVPPGVHLHWYGKGEIRSGRKLGHLNVAVRSPSELPDFLEILESCVLKWEVNLKRVGAGRPERKI